MKKYFLVLLSACFCALCFGCSGRPPQTDALKINVEYCYGQDNSISLGIACEDGVNYEINYYVNGTAHLLHPKQTRVVGGVLQCEILGLKAGENKLDITATKGEKSANKSINGIIVTDLDRSGYAHFANDDGVGAYNNDGTLKPTARIIYLTNENKNTMTETFGGNTVKGIVPVLQSLAQSSQPVVIRVLGKITTNQWKPKSQQPRLVDDSNLTADFFQNEFETTYGENVVGLTVNVNDARDGKSYKYLTTETGVTLSRMGTTSKKTITYKGNEYPSLKGKTTYSDDSFFNMVEVKNAKNITIEGVFDDAEIFQWGIAFRQSNSIEVRNLTFSDYTEDAVSFSGNSGSSGAPSSAQGYPYRGFFVHHNTFTRGKNNWDVTGERDKYAGDGTIDCNESANITIAYNKIDNAKKCILISSSDDNKCNNLTMHHNYFTEVESRLPFSRHTNIHTYNNFFNNCNNASNIRANGFLVSECNYYLNTKKPLAVGTAFVGDKSAIKSINDVFSGCTFGNAVVVLQRTQSVENSCDTVLGQDYSCFDTSESLFYFDAQNGVSRVKVMHTAQEVPTVVPLLSGVKKINKN